jgi:hypothetical protein
MDHVSGVFLVSDPDPGRRPHSSVSARTSRCFAELGPRPGSAQAADCLYARQRRYRIRHQNGQSHLEKTDRVDITPEEGVTMIDGDEDRANDNGITQGTPDDRSGKRQMEPPIRLIFF